MITLSVPAKRMPGDNPKGSLAALRALKTRVDNQLEKLGENDPARDDLNVKFEDYTRRIAKLIKEHPELAAAASTKRRRSSSRSRRFIDDDGNVDRAEIMARYHNAQVSIEHHIKRLFFPDPPKPAATEKAKPAPVKKPARAKAKASKTKTAPTAKAA